MGDQDFERIAESGGASWHCVSGFALVELMFAVLILTIGLLAAGQPVFMALTGASMARSKTVGASLAQNKLEQLGGLYAQSPDSADLAIGSHGPELIKINDPIDGNLLNCFNVEWTVGAVADPRPDGDLHARQITVTVTPVDAVGRSNRAVLLNTTVTLSSIYSLRAS